MQQAPQAMWEEYQRRRSPELRRDLALQYLNLVRYAAARYGETAAHTPGMLEVRDLVQVGVIGLLDAIDRYDPARGVKFETYAMTRIRGTIQDELRKLDWVPRSVRKKEREQIGGVEGTGLCRSVGHLQNSHYMEEAMGVMMDATMGEPWAVENLSAEGSPDPLEKVGMDQLKAMLIEMVEKLPDDERMIITLYYYEELTFREIGNILRLSESRVSQKHAAVMKKFRAQFAESIE